MLESALLVGGESSVSSHETAPVRLHTELSLEWSFRGNDRRLGVFGSLAPGRDDLRSGFGLRATQPLGDRYAIQAGAGPIFSNRRDGKGVQTRVGLMLPRYVSIVGLWQRIDFAATRTAPRESTDSFYAGAMVHGAPGTIGSLAAWLVITVMAVHDMGEAFSGGWLN